MPIFYIDPVNGNDTTGVGSQATPWKTIEAGATAARIAPGDEIRIAKSPDPASLGTITFTNDSAIATLATARTMEIDNCESAWSPATNITCNTVNNQYYYCQGTKGAWMQPGSSFATGVMAWKTLATATDFSAFEKISFFLRTNYNYAANSLRLDLCSDADGRVPVNSFALVTYAATGNNQYHVYDNGGPLGSGIRSIAIRALTDPGTNSVYIDNIIATNDISHHTPIGKNDGFWYPIKSISGATIELGYDTSSIVYKGTTATGAGYYQETNVIGAGANPLRCQESGSEGNITLYRGGGILHPRRRTGSPGIPRSITMKWTARALTRKAMSNSRISAWSAGTMFFIFRTMRTRTGSPLRTLMLPGEGRAGCSAPIRSLTGAWIAS